MYICRRTPNRQFSIQFCIDKREAHVPVSLSKTTSSTTCPPAPTQEITYDSAKLKFIPDICKYLANKN